ncbi:MULTISPECIES: hypothetical protein [Sphingobacterium]|uniref:hypothetical protein n=1 Tax=Sphingobacterium TaxID=28453 RepID=UPI0028AF1BE1|nr:hypothetical protein [Sphingobacterium multivorum]
MNIKATLSRICRKIEHIGANEITNDFNEDYAKGYEHATKLLCIAMVNEFGDYVQIEENKALVIRGLKKKIEDLEKKCLAQKLNIDKMGDLLNRTSTITLSNNKKKKIFRAVAEITGQPYEYIKEQFVELLDGKLIKSKNLNK